MSKKNLYSLIIMLIIIFLVVFIIIRGTESSLELNKLSNMYKDIKVLEDKISMYYLENGIIPIKSKIENFKENSINPNDNDNFYEIDLEKLENISLYYGKKVNSQKDIYIINEQSHTIYYYEGINYKDYTIFTKELEYKNIQIENYQ